MKKHRKKKLIALTMAMLLLVGISAGCASGNTVDIFPLFTGAPTDDENVIIDLALEMVPLTASPANSVLKTEATGKLTKSNTKATIDYSNTADGYVMVKFMNSTTKELRVLVTGPSGTQYQYTLKKNATYEVYPLSDGNGKYTIGVYEQVEGSKYSTAVSASIDVKLTDEFAPLLRPNQYVNFTEKSAVVAKAAELVKDKKTLVDKISAVYEYVIKNLTYDKKLAETVKSGYLPDVDAVMKAGKGICFDYAAVMTAMLRSQGIPTKLVVGYASNVYHAWIDVYSDTDGWIGNVIYFDGKDWKLMDPTFASGGNSSESIMKYIGDGKNYSAKFLY